MDYLLKGARDALLARKIDGKFVFTAPRAITYSCEGGNSRAFHLLKCKFFPTLRPCFHRPLLLIHYLHKIVHCAYSSFRLDYQNNTFLFVHYVTIARVLRNRVQIFTDF